MSEGTILVVDDDPSARKIIEVFLSTDGFTFLHAGSAEEAFRSLASHEVDVVLCDVMMPGTDGFEVCRAVKAHPSWRTIPIVLVTALDGQDDMVRGLEAGADEFLSKPVNRAVLRARVRAQMRVRRQYKELGQARHRDLESLFRARRDALATEAELTEREREVLDLLLLGRSHDEIGVALGISARTAKFHQGNVLEKLGLDSRMDLPRLFLM